MKLERILEPVQVCCTASQYSCPHITTNQKVSQEAFPWANTYLSLALPIINFIGGILSRIHTFLLETDISTAQDSKFPRNKSCWVLVATLFIATSRLPMKIMLTRTITWSNIHMPSLLTKVSTTSSTNPAYSEGQAIQVCNSLLWCHKNMSSTPCAFITSKVIPNIIAFHLEGSEMAFSGVMYSTSNAPFSASLLTELFIWVLPRYSDFTPFCFKLITCFKEMKSSPSILVKEI